MRDAIQWTQRTPTEQQAAQLAAARAEWEADRTFTAYLNYRTIELSIYRPDLPPPTAESEIGMQHLLWREETDRQYEAIRAAWDNQPQNMVCDDDDGGEARYEAMDEFERDEWEQRYGALPHLNLDMYRY